MLDATGTKPSRQFARYWRNKGASESYINARWRAKEEAKLHGKKLDSTWEPPEGIEGPDAASSTPASSTPASEPPASEPPASEPPASSTPFVPRKTHEAFQLPLPDMKEETQESQVSDIEILDDEVTEPERPYFVPKTIEEAKETYILGSFGMMQSPMWQHCPDFGTLVMLLRQGCNAMGFDVTVHNATSIAQSIAGPLRHVLAIREEDSEPSFAMDFLFAALALYRGQNTLVSKADESKKERIKEIEKEWEEWFKKSAGLQ